MKPLVIVVALSILATTATALPMIPIKHDNAETIVMVAKRGGSSRSAISGRFVTRGHAARNKSTTVTHGKY
jgi:hypothetical protein